MFFQHENRNFPISAWPSNILYLYTRRKKINVWKLNKYQPTLSCNMKLVVHKHLSQVIICRNTCLVSGLLIQVIAVMNGRWPKMHRPHGKMGQYSILLRRSHLQHMHNIAITFVPYLQRSLSFASSWETSASRESLLPLCHDFVFKLKPFHM